MKPGHYPELTNEAYHGGPGISKSHLDKIAASPAHYYAAYLDPNRAPREATPAMIQGTAIHTAVLEPHLFESEYIVVPAGMPTKPTDRQRNAKKPSSETVDAILAWDEFELFSATKTILTAEQWHVALEVQRSVRKHKAAADLLRKGHAEHSYFSLDPDTGALVKARPDWFTPAGVLVDLKSTKSAAPDAFYRSVMDFGYDLQPWWYRNAIGAAIDEDLDGAPWYFVAVEKEPPYAVAVYRLPPEVERAGAMRARQLLQKIVDAKLLDHWPAYSDDISILEFPGWALRKLGCNSAEADFA